MGQTTRRQAQSPEHILSALSRAVRSSEGCTTLPNCPARDSPSSQLLESSEHRILSRLLKRPKRVANASLPDSAEMELYLHDQYIPSMTRHLDNSLWESALSVRSMSRNFVTLYANRLQLAIHFLTRICNSTGSQYRVVGWLQTLNKKDVEAVVAYFKVLFHVELEKKTATASSWTQIRTRGVQVPL